jgi:hypothetical protein
MPRTVAKAFGRAFVLIVAMTGCSTKAKRDGHQYRNEV